MEKDYFLDRHPIVNSHDKVKPGDEVFICLKNMQPYAKELHDLTRITVSNYLTSQEYHPRGQKVKGIEKIWDDKEKEYKYEERVGRMTYKIFDGRAVLTKEGFKYIVEEGKKLELRKFEEIRNWFNLCLIFSYADFSFKVIFNPNKYFKTIEEASEFIKSIKIINIKLSQDKITYFLNGREYEDKNYKIFYKDSLLNMTPIDFFEIFSNQYQADNNSIYTFNKIYNLAIKSFELQKPTILEETED